MQSGIYLITNIRNGRRYVGSSKNIETRRQDHLTALERGKHANYRMQEDYELIGLAAFDYFKFQILELCDCDNLIAREKYYWTLLKPEYNIYPPGETTRGKKLSINHRNKMSIARKGLTNAAKLSNNQIWYIRNSTEPKEVLARKFKVSRKTIYNIQHSVTYSTSQVTRK